MSIELVPGLLHETEYRVQNNRVNIEAAPLQDVVRAHTEITARDTIMVANFSNQPLELRALRMAGLVDSHYTRERLHQFEESQKCLLLSRIAIRELCAQGLRGLTMASPAGIHRLPPDFTIDSAEYVTEPLPHNVSDTDRTCLKPLDVINPNKPVKILNLAPESAVEFLCADGSKVFLPREADRLPIDVSYDHHFVDTTDRGVPFTQALSGELLNFPRDLDPNTLLFVRVEVAYAALFDTTLSPQDRARLVFMNGTFRDDEFNNLPRCTGFAYLDEFTRRRTIDTATF